MRAQAIAITGKVIRYVGDDRRVAAQIGPGTKVIDIKGRMLPSADLDFQGYQQLEKQGRLPVRVVVGSYYWNNPGIADPLPQQREKATSAAVTSKVRPAAGPCRSVLNVQTEQGGVAKQDRAGFVVEQALHLLELDGQWLREIHR